LTTLDLHNNHLRALPTEVGQFANLTELLVVRNPLWWPPSEIVAKGTRAIRAFLRAQHLQGTVRLWRSKLVVVGEPGVGKTSLVNVLSGKEFNDHEATTHGLRAHKPIELAHPKETGVMMKLFAWDFGGQESYHATHQFFLTDRALFFLSAVGKARNATKQTEWAAFLLPPVLRTKSR
jgi:internalin A